MVFHTKPFKKDITPFAKGGRVVKHVGKGAKEQSSRFGENLTGGDPYARSTNNYPKAPAPDFSQVGDLGGPALGSSPVPMGSKPPGAPTAMMPPSAGGEQQVLGDDEE